MANVKEKRKPKRLKEKQLELWVHVVGRRSGTT
jgi:hypothetical protein